MQSNCFRRSFSIVSACCAVLVVLGTSPIQAAEFKPFLTIQIAGPNALINIIEKVESIARLPQLTEFKTMATPFKSMPGVNNAGSIGLAISANEESAIGVDVILSLPISNFATFNIPGQEMYVMAMKMMAKPEGNKFTFNTPGGNFVGYQKQGFFLLATEGAAEFAATADHKTLFAEVSEFTLGAHANLENITEETVEKIMGTISMLLAMQGMEGSADPEALSTFRDQAAAAIEEMASMTWGITIDSRTLNCSGLTKTVAKEGTELIESFTKSKEALAKTKMGAFLSDTPQTVLAWHYLHYFTHKEIEDNRMVWKLVSEGLLEGLYESMEDGDADEKQLEKLAAAVEAFLNYIDEGIDILARERLLDATCWLDSEGTLILAVGTDKTSEAMALDEKFYSKLKRIFGNEFITLVEGKVKRNYETVAGYSLSCISNVFSDLPADIDVPEGVKEILTNIPLSLFWAVKEGEALVYAIGLDFGKTEQALKAAMGRTQTPPRPQKQIGFIAMKPLAEFIQSKILPFLPNMPGSEITKMQTFFTPFTGMNASVRYVFEEEYPDASYFQAVQIPGEFVTAVLKMVVEANQAAER